MNVEEYTQIVSDQIRSKKARPFVVKELQDHIRDQTAAYEAEGESKEEALDRAVMEMGDPAEVGIELDRIHRPQMSWETIAIVGLISVLSLLVQFLLQGADTEGNIGMMHLGHVVIGFILMIAIYRMDYSVLGKYSRVVAIFFLIVMTINIFYFGFMINGARNYLNIGGLFISLTPVMLLYIPLFGGVLYSYRGKGYGTLWQLILWAGVPIWITFKIPSVMTSAILLFSMAALFSFAVAKGWYQVSRRWTLIVMWSVLILAPIVRISVVFLSGAPSYQVDRLMSWITRDEQMNYTANRLREIIMNSSFVGKNEIARQIVSQKLPDVNADYVLAGIMSMYGVAVAGIVIALLIGLIYKIFHISLRQKNQLGMMIGLGCGMVFLMQTITNVMVIFNLLPMTGIVLPLFSHGGTGIAVSYILLGIVLSIYRYKDISCERKIAKGYL